MKVDNIMASRPNRRVYLGCAVGLAVTLAGCSTAHSSPSTPTEATEVEDKEVETGTISLEGLPITQSFRFQNGEVQVEFPIRVEFQEPDGEDWTTVRAHRVDELEWVTVELVGGQRYRIVIEDAEGVRRSIGVYTPVNKDAEHTVLIGGCCSDDFSEATA